MNDLLTTMLRDAAAQETLPARPAAEVRRHAEQVRNRRRAGVAAAGIAAAVALGLVAQGSLSPGTWFATSVPSGQDPGPTTVVPAPAPSTPGPTSSATRSSGVTDDADDTNDSDGTVTGETPWPAPPTSRVERPWTQPGFDAGDIVAARMEDGHAVITVDRIQFYSAEQWKTKTGESIDSDFRTVNESTRTRQFVIEDGAVISVNWQYGETGGPVTLTPQEFVDRTNAALLDLAVGRREPGAGPSTSPEDTPSVRVFLFHRDRLDGTVGYVEDVGMYTG
jgi:hypothetical protein